MVARRQELCPAVRGKRMTKRWWRSLREAHLFPQGSSGWLPVEGSESLREMSPRDLLVVSPGHKGAGCPSGWGWVPTDPE